MSNPLLPPNDWRSRLVEIGNYRLPLPKGWQWPASWQKPASVSEQRSLLRWILAATEQQVPFTSLVEAWAKAERPTQRLRLQKLADQLRSDMPLAEAIESVPGLLSQERLLAIRCAVQTGSLPQTLRQLLAERDDLLIDHAEEYGKSRFWYYTAAETLAIASVTTFMAIKILPTLEMIANEIGVPATDVRQVTQWWRLLTHTYFVPAMVTLVVIFWGYWTGLWARLWRSTDNRRNSWLGWLHEALGTSQRQVLRLIKPSLEAGRPLPAVMSSLARYHHQPGVRHDLLFARNEMELGTPDWEALRAVGQINAVEASLMAEADRPQDRAWILDRLMQHHQWKMERNRGRCSAIARPLVVLLLSLLVFRIAWMLISTLASFVAV